MPVYGKRISDKIKVNNEKVSNDYIERENMNKQVLRDHRGVKIDEIEDYGYKQVLRDHRGIKLGEFDGRVTRDARGIKIGEGNLLAMLLNSH